MRRNENRTPYNKIVHYQSWVSYGRDRIQREGSITILNNGRSKNEDDTAYTLFEEENMYTS